MTTERRPSARSLLSIAEKRKIRIKVTPEKKEGDVNPKGLPPISEDQRLQLLIFLNLDQDPNALFEQAQQTGEIFYHPLVLAAQMVEEEFGVLIKNCEPQTIPIRDWVNKNFGYDVNAVNSAAIGAALVVKAYHLMYGEKFVDGFSKLKSIDVMNSMDAETRLPEERLSLISSATRTYRMPSHQFNLQYCLTQIGMCAPNGRAVLDGGTAVFRMLDRHAEEMELINPV